MTNSIVYESSYTTKMFDSDLARLGGPIVRHVDSINRYASEYEVFAAATSRGFGMYRVGSYICIQKYRAVRYVIDTDPKVKLAA
jgi:hypothetical protein